MKPEHATDQHAPPPARERSPTRLTLAERTAYTNERNRDCRSCKAFVPGPSGMSFGWCQAFKMPVKLYHPAQQFYSQCQFKVLTRAVRNP